MKSKKSVLNGARFAFAAALLAGCASPGTRVSTDSSFYRESAKTQQQLWCWQFGCGCEIDGSPATCSLVSTCLSTNSCRQSTQ